MSEFLVQTLVYCFITVLMLLVWAVSSIVFLFVFCLPFLIEDIVYKFRYGALDKFCENLVSTVKIDGAYTIAGTRDPVLVDVYKANRSYVQVIIGLASLYLLLLLKKRGEKVARHFALTFKDIGEEFRDVHCDIFKLVGIVLNDIKPNTEIEMIYLYNRVAEVWCSMYKSLPGLGLLTWMEYEAFFSLVASKIGLSVIGYHKECLIYTKQDKTFIDNGIISWEIVSEEGFWQRYMSFAENVSTLFFRLPRKRM